MSVNLRSQSLQQNSVQLSQRDNEKRNNLIKQLYEQSQAMSANGHEVLRLRQEALSASPAKGAADVRKASVVKYFRQDRN